MAVSRTALARSTLLGLMLFSLCLGCAKELTIPHAPPGDPCTSLDDCAPAGEPVCGALRACVDGVCEATPSLYRQCP